MFSRGVPVQVDIDQAKAPNFKTDPVQFYSELNHAPVVYKDQDFALLEGISRTGAPVYFGVMANGGVTKKPNGDITDVESYSGQLVPKFILDRMIDQKKIRLQENEKIAKANQSGPFTSGSNVAFDKNFPESLRGWTSGLIKELNLGSAKILFVDTKSATDPDFYKRNNLFGDYFVGRLASFSGGNFGVSINRVGEDFHTIVVDTNNRTSIQIETIAHEIGHVFDKQILKKESKAVQDEIMDAFDRWLLKNKALPSKEYIKLLRTAVVGKRISQGLNNDSAMKELDGYYRKYSEWFADQVARWSLTSKPAETLMGRFFQRIAAAYRKIISAMGQAGLPDQTVAKFIEKHRSYGFVKLPDVQGVVFDPVKTKGWTKKPKQLSFDMSARIVPEREMAAERNMGQFSPSDVSIEASRGPLFTPPAAPTQPPTPQPNLPLGSAADFYKAVIPELNKSSVLDRVLSVLIDKKKDESVSAAIARTSINRASSFHNLDQMNAVNGYTGRSAGQAIEMALTNTGRVAQMFATGVGRINPATGEVSLRYDVKPLLQIMQEAGAQDEDTKKGLQVYLAALKERDLRANGRQGFTQIPDGAVADAITQAEVSHPEWKQTAADLDKLNNALIDWSLDSGIIDAKQAQALRDVFYTPFYRVMEKNSIEDPSRSVTPKIGESFTNVASAINRELKGGESPLGDLIANIVLNADSIMKAGLKNLAMRASAESMEFAKLAQRNYTQKKDANTITFKVDGKDVSYDVSDPVLFSALAGMPRTMQNGIYSTMAKTASVFRDFVTAMPSFIISNLYKGKITAFVQEGQPFRTNTFAGLRDAYNSTTSLQNFQLQTGFGGMEYGMESRDMAKAFERKLSDKGVMNALGKFKVLSAIRQGFNKMQAISEASEMAERIKLAENLIKKGMEPRDAYFQAYLLAPYSRRGTGEGWVGSTLQFLMPLVPFLNAKLQTTYRLVENEKGNKRRLWTLGLPQQIFLRGLVVTAFSLLAYGLNLEDEDEWNDIPNYMKLNYDIIPFMGEYITLPRAFEIGQVFGALPVFVLDAIRRGEGKDLTEALIEVGKNTFWMNPMPKAVDPIIAALTNYDFFRMRPLETKGEEALPVGERINRSTTKTGEALSATVNSVFGDVLSPIKAQALLDGYTGTLGVTVMSGFDSVLSMLGVIPGKPAQAFGDPSSPPTMVANALGLNRFYREKETMVSRFVGDFYKIKEMTDQIVRSQNLARQNGDFERLRELQGEEGLPLRIRDTVNRASTQIADINKRIRIIEKRDIDGVAKADAIRPLINQRDRIAKGVVDRARAIGAL
jgi:hypothetical protein